MNILGKKESKDNPILEDSSVLVAQRARLASRMQGTSKWLIPATNCRLFSFSALTSGTIGSYFLPSWKDTGYWAMRHRIVLLNIRCVPSEWLENPRSLVKHFLQNSGFPRGAPTSTGQCSKISRAHAYLRHHSAPYGINVGRNNLWEYRGKPFFTHRWLIGIMYLV